MTKTSVGVQELRTRIGEKAKADPQHCFCTKRRGGRTWTTWSAEEIYGAWGLFHDYRVLPRSEPRAATRIGPLTDSTGNAGWRKSPCPV